MSEVGARYIKLTENGTADIAKGDLCVIRAGLVKKIVNATDPGPYVVAKEAVLTSSDGVFLLEGVIEMDEGADGAVTTGDLAVPSGTTIGDVKAGVVTQAVFDDNASVTDFVGGDTGFTFPGSTDTDELRHTVGMFLDSGASDGTYAVLLGFRSGLSAT